MSILDVTLRQFLIFAAYALPAVLVWYFLFRMENNRSLPQETIRDTFMIGILSVVPLLLYQSIYTGKILQSLPTWLTNLLPSNIAQAFSTISADNLGNIFTVGSGTNVLGSVLQMMLGFASLGVLFVVVIGGFTIFYSLFTKQSAVNTFKALTSEPLNFSATSFIFLIVLGIDLALRTFTPIHIRPGIIGSTFILAMLEEYSKHLFVRLFDDHKIKNIANAIELSMVVALSFAFFENIVYANSTPGSSISSVIIGRSVTSMFGHVIFSSIFGYYYGISKFAKSFMLVESVETHLPALPQWLYKIFRFKTADSFKAQKIFEGLLFATLAHTLFNLSLEYDFFVGAILILVGGGYLIYLMISSELVQRELSLVGSKEMPQEDFEKLVWKISVMKHLQEIKRDHPDAKEK